MTDKILVTKWKKRRKWLLKKETSEISRLPAYIVSIVDMGDKEKAINKWVLKWAGKSDQWGWSIKCANPSNCCRKNHPESMDFDCELQGV